MIEQIKQKAQKWLEGNFDEETKKQVKYLLENDEKELEESFYKDLQFGTGGLRGIMGVGTNRINIYTVGLATQGFANYLAENFSQIKQIKVAIAYDNRNNSRLYAETTAKIFSAKGFKVYLFDSLRPTPELSFAIRHFGCQGGVVVTASHNPKEYNGYKAYWNDGGQLIAPHDQNVVDEFMKLSIEDINFNEKSENIEIIGKEIDKIYLEKIKSLSLSPESIKNQADLKIVYTPIHGTGVELVPESLKNFGFTNVSNIEEQDVVDGNFPTVISPNPENVEALEMAMAKAIEIDADIVMATDPDADRVGIAVKNNKNEFVILNGNQTGTILVYYLIKKWQENGKLTGKEYVCKTIVTTELIKEIANKFKVEIFDVLTGFKFIADLIRKNEGKKTFIGGGEESYGYLAGEFVRDKDAVMACALIAETAAWAKDQGKTLYDLLIDIYVEFGFYKERLVNVVKKGKSGEEEIKKMMETYRSNPPKAINDSKILLIKDYLTQQSIDVESRKTEVIDLPKSNVLQFFLADGTKISVRPSGTEPKIKFYVSARMDLASKDEFANTEQKIEKKLDKIVSEFQ